MHSLLSMSFSKVTFRIRSCILPGTIVTLTASGLVLMPTVGGGAENVSPEKQKESDWVDARWSQTDLGNFHSSVVALPGGAVGKGLSIRVGGKGEAAVAYETGSASLRAGWKDGFLTFNGSRYGLMHAPKPAGKIQLSLPDKAWGKASVRWRGLHVHGPRVVLDYQVSNTRVKESPWYIEGDDVGAFVRTLELGPSRQPLMLTLVQGEGREFNLKSIEDVNIASLSRGDEAIALATTGDMAAD